jgi:hypothetical protein
MQDPQRTPGPLKTIVLYGNSLVVSSFGASLQGIPGLRILSIEAGLPDAAQRLQALKPDIILFDLATAHPDFAIPLWKTYPGLLLIGVDLSGGELLVLSGCREQVLDVSDLLEVIHGGAVVSK